MKNFLLGVIVITLLSFTAINTDIITIKPAKPKEVVVGSYNSKDDCTEGIKSYIRKGFITKSVSGTNQYGYDWIIVMEKY